MDANAPAPVVITVVFVHEAALQALGQEGGVIAHIAHKVGATQLQVQGMRLRPAGLCTCHKQQKAQKNPMCFRLIQACKYSPSAAGQFRRSMPQSNLLRRVLANSWSPI